MSGRCLALILLLLAPLAAHTAGLGRLTVISTLGEPFNAQVELISAGELDLSSLTARLASPETYQRLNLRYGTARARLVVTVERPPAGRPYIKIVSPEYVHEPILPLLIELEWSAGRFLRSYTALLDLPRVDASAPVPFVAGPAVERLAVAPAPETPNRTAGDATPPATPSRVAREAAPPVTPKTVAAAPASPPAETKAPAAARPAPAAVPAPAAAQKELDARARTLEQELAASDKQLGAVNDRIAQLEQTIKDMQRLADAGTPAPQASKPAPAAEKPPAVPAAPEPAVEKPAATAAAPEPAAEKPPAAPAPATARAPAKAAPAVAASPPPPAESGLMDAVMENLPLVGGGAVAALLLAWLALARRRRGAPEAAATTATDDTSESAAATGDDDRPPGPGAGRDAEQVDPIEEAEVFIAHGREAQAAQLLEEAVAANPARADVWLKLLEVSAARKDKDAFGRHAQAFHELTGGRGENWLKAAALGYALDPENVLYEAGKGVEPPAAPAEPETLDFNARGDTPGKTEARDTGDDTFAEPMAKSADEPDAERAPAVDIDVAASGGETAADFPIDEPESGTTATDLNLDAGSESAKAEDALPVMDFKIELPPAGGPSDAPAADAAEEKPDAAEPEAVREEPEPPAQESADEKPEKEPETDMTIEPPPELKLDLSGINLELDDTRKAAAESAEGKDPHWQDVQEKFELVRAYQVLGADVDSLVEILQEIVKEGDAQQRADARKLMERLGQGKE